MGQAFDPRALKSSLTHGAGVWTQIGTQDVAHEIELLENMLNEVFCN